MNCEVAAPSTKSPWNIQQDWTKDTWNQCKWGWVGKIWINEVIQFKEFIASPDKLYSQFLVGKQSPQFTKWLRWIPHCRVLNPHKPFFSFCTHHLHSNPRRGSRGSRQSRWCSQKSLQTQAWMWTRWVWWDWRGPLGEQDREWRTRVERGGYRTARWCKALRLHSGCIFVWESASPYQERWPGGGTERAS